jgi:hypothetical protein
MRECLLPLAEQHASLGLAQSLQAEGTAPSKTETNPGTQHTNVQLASYSSAALHLPSSRPQRCSCVGALAKGKETQDYWAARVNHWVLVGWQQATTAESRVCMCDLHQRDATAFQMLPHASMAC